MPEAAAVAGREILGAVIGALLGAFVGYQLVRSLLLDTLERFGLELAWNIARDGNQKSVLAQNFSLEHFLMGPIGMKLMIGSALGLLLGAAIGNRLASTSRRASS